MFVLLQYDVALWPPLMLTTAVSPSRFTEVDVEQHIAACLAGDLRDFEEDDVIILD